MNSSKGSSGDKPAPLGTAATATSMSPGGLSPMSPPPPKPSMALSPMSTSVTHAPSIPVPALSTSVSTHLPSIAGPEPTSAATMSLPAVEPPNTPTNTRNRFGLRREDDKKLIRFRSSNSQMGPHSGAMFQDQHRKKTVTGYPGQSYAHDELRTSGNKFAAQSTEAEPISSLEAAIHMASTQLHVTLPGPELSAALTHGYSVLQDIGSLAKPPERDKLSGNIHERLEQTKSNIFKAAEYLPAKRRKIVAMPSPQRESMEHGGGYITPPSSPYHGNFDAHDGAMSATALSVEEQRNISRQIMTPLMEPSWEPAPRAKGVAPTPFHGSDVDEVRKAFTTQDGHSPEIAHEATEKYVSGTKPTPDEVRVSSVESKAFYATKKKRKAAGAHEVVPTDRAEDIVDLPAHARTPMAHAQADVRTNTALTFFRSHEEEQDK